MAEVKYANMQIVPEKFSQYTIDRTTQLSTLVNSGIATGDAIVGGLINGTPEGGKFIMLPAYNDLEGEDETFGEHDLTNIGDITTKASHATLLMRQRAWGATDLAHILGGNDPMAAIGNLVSGWWVRREQAIYLSILKGVFGNALKDHVNDISAGSGEAAYISDAATLDTKQCLGDHYGSLGMVFMHSAVYTYLQKKGMITRNPIFDPSQSAVEMERYLNYKITIDDTMPVTDGVYDTYFLGNGAFIRQDGSPAGFVGTETDRDKFGAKNYLINRRCMVIHPRGFSWNVNAVLEENGNKVEYPTNANLADPANWTLATDHKKIAMACLRHKIG